MNSGKKRNSNSYGNINGPFLKKYKGQKDKWWILWLCFFVCMCLAILAILVLVSILFDRDIHDNDDDGAINSPLEQSVWLNGFLKNTEQLENFTRCLSGCGAGMPIVCRSDTDCIDPEQCIGICGGRFQGNKPLVFNTCRQNSECQDSKLCEKICIRRTVVGASCPFDCLCATSDPRPPSCPPIPS